VTAAKRPSGKTMEMSDLILWLVLGLAYACSAVGLQRLFLRFIQPFRHHTRSAAEHT
jgi:hypothetical protein